MYEIIYFKEKNQDIIFRKCKSSDMDRLFRLEYIAPTGTGTTI